MVCEMCTILRGLVFFKLNRWYLAQHLALAGQPQPWRRSHKAFTKPTFEPVSAPRLLI